MTSLVKQYRYFGSKVAVVTIKSRHNSFVFQLRVAGLDDGRVMSLIRKVLAVFLFLIGGCFPFVIRKKKIKYQRKGHFCSCTDYQTSRQESIDSIDSVSVVEPTTWHIPSKGRKRIRTISGASNFSGTSTMSTLSEKDRLWLQAFRFAGRWDSESSNGRFWRDARSETENGNRNWTMSHRRVNCEF